MKKRTLAQAFQASLKKNDSISDNNEKWNENQSDNNGQDRDCKQTLTETTADEPDIDYMSDTMLEKLAANERPLELTYSQRQTKRRIDEAERRRQAMYDAEARQREKARMPHLGEVEARQRGLATNVLENAIKPQPDGPAIGAGTHAALEMMKAMGFDISYKDDAAATHNPLMPDERWLSSSKSHVPRRQGIGHAEISKQIAQAKEAASPVPLSVDAFRQLQSDRANQKHLEGILNKARSTCRALDEANGWDVRTWTV